MSHIAGFRGVEVAGRLLCVRVMLNPKLTCLSVLVVVGSACGPYEPAKNPYPPGYDENGNPITSFVAGQACSSHSQCGDGYCTNWGTCAKDCADSSDCGNGGVCVTFSTGVKQCHQLCSPSNDRCSSGFQCEAFTSSTTRGYCRPQEEDKEPVGAACSLNSECATNLCAAWPGGYCSKGCNSGSDCSSGSICVAEAINGVNACLETCSGVGTRSSCRAGYVCVGLQGKSFGVCAPDEDTGSGGAGGGGGGTGGSGGSGGGSPPPMRCRTFATSYTEVFMTSMGTQSVTHTVSFDRNALKLTDSMPGLTRVETYGSLADFIDMADAVTLTGRGGPKTVVTTTASASLTTTHAYDSQRRLLNSSTMATVSGQTWEYERIVINTWDPRGRATGGTINLNGAVVTEKCEAAALIREYDDVTRRYIDRRSSGRSSSASGKNNCPFTKTTVNYNGNFIVRDHHFEDTNKPENTYRSSWTVHTTATVCM